MIVREPYVWILLPLAVSNGGPVCLMCVLSPVAGRTLTCAPMSTRYWLLVTESVMNSKPLLWPAAVATSGRPAHFPAIHMAVYTF